MGNELQSRRLRCLPVSASKSRNVRPPEADARYLPSGEKTTELASLVWRNRRVPSRATAPSGSESPSPSRREGGFVSSSPAVAGDEQSRQAASTSKGGAEDMDPRPGKEEAG